MRTTHSRLLAALTLVMSTAAFVGLAAPGAGAATGTGAEFAPSVRPTELHLQRTERGSAVTIHWRGHDRYRSLYWYDVDPVDDRSFVDMVGSTERRGTGLPGAARFVQFGRNVPQVQPDGWSHLNGDVMGYAWPLVARVRSGGSLLVTTFGGRQVLRATTRLGGNECAGMVAGTRVVDLDPATLVPRRVVDRRGGVLESDIRFAPRRARATDFAPIRAIGRQEIRDERFTRHASASAVASLVSWPISMPSSVPAGFSLAHVGHAPLGGMMGPEGSFPRSRGVFFARWAYGLETLDFTIRPARSTLMRDWDESDPFGGECESATESETMVGTNVARYAQGQFGAPRLWWRDGTTLYTLSGPMSKEQLATVARSLVPVEG